MNVGMVCHLLFQLLRCAITNDDSHSVTACVIRIALASSNRMDMAMTGSTVKSSAWYL